MKPISELVILALATRLRGAPFLSYKTLAHFIIGYLSDFLSLVVADA